MYLNEILSEHKQPEKQSTIGSSCSDFLSQSNGTPLLKNLPIQYNDVHKVKVRYKHTDNEVTKSFNQAFQQDFYNISQRAIFANGSRSFTESSDGNTEAFYVFPINGYKFMYCTEINSSTAQYKKAFDSLFEKLGNDKQKAIEILTELLKYTYTSINLHEGIKTGSEIIIYNIPYYYAIRTKTYPKYDQLLTLLK